MNSIDNSSSDISYFTPLNSSISSFKLDNVVDLSNDFEHQFKEVSVELLEADLEPAYMDGYRLEGKKEIPSKIAVKYSEEYYKMLEEQREKSIAELESRGFVRENNTNVWIMKAFLETAQS